MTSRISELLLRARSGDRQALDRLFGACRHYLSVLAQTELGNRLRSKVDPSDLVQQTLLEAYKGFDGFHGASEAEWLAWLRGILGHNAADFARYYRDAGKRQIEREVRFAAEGADSSISGIMEPGDGGERPSEQLIREERELQLAEAISRLDEDQRTVIVLRNLQRLPFDEVAAQMGRSRPAAQMLWMRAVRKLQTLLDNCV
jgi:RNA polymerase sigma-70 factor (ECF subfamily)